MVIKKAAVSTPGAQIAAKQTAPVRKDDGANVVDEAKARQAAPDDANSFERRPPMDPQLSTARELLDAGRTDDAAVLLRDLVGAFTDYPSRAIAAMQLSQLELRRGNNEPAIELAKLNFGDAPDPVVGLIHLFASTALHAKRDFKGALGAAEAAYSARFHASNAFQVAVMRKNLGDLAGAFPLLDEAIAKEPERLDFVIASLGYQYLAGDKEAAVASFDALSPKADQQLGYEMNAAWFSALRGDPDAAAGHLAACLKLTDALGTSAAVLAYVEGEVDFDPIRDHASFRAVVDKAQASEAGGTTVSGAMAQVAGKLSADES